MPIRERMIPMNPYNKRERMRKCRQRWEAKNPNYRREYQRKWRQNNLEHCREYSRNYYARRRESDPEWAEERRKYQREYQRKRNRTDEGWRQRRRASARKRKYRKKIKVLYDMIAEHGTIYLFNLDGKNYPVCNSPGCRPEDYYGWDDENQRMVNRIKNPK